MNKGRRVFGLHSAETAIQLGARSVKSAWVDTQRSDARLARLKEFLEKSAIPWEPATRKRLDELARGGNHQGVVLDLDLPKERNERELYELLDAAGPEALVLVLDQIQDPQNLGACLRTADAAGVTAVVIPKDQAVGLTPTVAKVASGAAETVPLFRVTSLARCLDQLKQCGLWIVGASGEADRALYQQELVGPIALVLGAEGKGMRRLTREKCDWIIHIPMVGSVTSLNVSVAAGVLLYEAFRQRRLHSSSGKL